jgi:hypothetical protein
MEDTLFEWNYSARFTQIADDCGYTTAAWHQLNIPGCVLDISRFELAQSIENAAREDYPWLQIQPQ